MNLRPVKACHSCRRSYDLADWSKLEIVGTDETTRDRHLVEHRRCACGEVLILDLTNAEQVDGALPEAVSLPPLPECFRMERRTAVAIGTLVAQALIYWQEHHDSEGNEVQPTEEPHG